VILYVLKAAYFRIAGMILQKISIFGDKIAGEKWGWRGQKEAYLCEIYHIHI
jgi:hypothetical protein